MEGDYEGFDALGQRKNKANLIWNVVFLLMA